MLMNHSTKFWVMGGSRSGSGLSRSGSWSGSGSRSGSWSGSGSRSGFMSEAGS